MEGESLVERRGSFERKVMVGKASMTAWGTRVSHDAIDPNARHTFTLHVYGGVVAIATITAGKKASTLKGVRDCE